MSYISKEELLKVVGEEPIVEDEKDKVQIAMVLQYRKLMDIINNLPTYDISFNEDKTVNIEVNRKFNYDPFKDIYSRKCINIPNPNPDRMSELIQKMTEDNQFKREFTGKWVSYNDKLKTGDITKMPRDWSESLL